MRKRNNILTFLLGALVFTLLLFFAQTSIAALDGKVKDRTSITSTFNPTDPVIAMDACLTIADFAFTIAAQDIQVNVYQNTRASWTGRSGPHNLSRDLIFTQKRLPQPVYQHRKHSYYRRS